MAHQSSNDSFLYSKGYDEGEKFSISDKISKGDSSQKAKRNLLA